MNVVVITSSPHAKGTTKLMAEKLIEGATEAGHSIFRFDAGMKNIHPCIACERCHTTDQGCVFKDDMEELNPKLLEADAVIFITPIYYYDWNAQIKCVMDRFYANNQALIESKKKVGLITMMADDTLESAEGANASYTNLVKFLGWENIGVINGIACWTVDDLMKTDYLEQAYKMGKEL